MVEAAALTPMFRQYRKLKHDHPDAMLLFRMGDFYELFYEDARVAAAALELTLTARGRGTENVAPMCGFPHHQVDAYTARLVRAGHRVAICDQVEDPRAAKGLVRREVVRIVTPGTVTDPAQLEAKENAWVAAVASVAGRAGAAFVDVTTGEFLAWESSEDGRPGEQALLDRLRSFAPREVVHGASFPWGERPAQLAGTRLTERDDDAFAPAPAAELLARHLGVASLDGFGLRDRPAATTAAGGLLHYLQETQRSRLEHVHALRYHEPQHFLLLDAATQRNLELERSLRDGGRDGSLVGTLDATLTGPGGRMLRRFLLAPLLDTTEIAARHEAVDELLRRGELRLAVREHQRRIQDIERIVARAVAGTAGARELAALRLSLERAPELLSELDGAAAPLLRRTLDGLDPCADLAALLERALVDDPPATLKDGGVIREGYDASLDEYRSLGRDGRAYIAAMESRERTVTGIASLKVRFNKVFGYYIEVSRPNLHLVPERYRRRQTISTGERFATPELEEHETKVLHAQERIEELELALFRGLRERVAAEAPRLRSLAGALALVDVLSAFAESAATHDYCRPRVDDGPTLSITGGRHPVVERNVEAGRFVPNDTSLELGGRALAVLTGPNMGGKSTYLRQVALIVLMAQAGSFVPAEAASFGVVDRIFCRVGASDSLSEGQSTFMVEMAETAHILHHATARSLVLLDEIGRGTSTFDGLSIAWAVVEHLCRDAARAPRTLFATHYHELTELAVELAGVLNLRMAVRGHGETVVFTHRVEPGAADRSYGIHVARLAGVPIAVVERAREILRNLERDEYSRDGLPRRARRDAAGPAAPAQASLFGLMEPAPPVDGQGPLAAEVLAELRSRDAARLTPLEALNLLAAWQERLKGADRQ
jgi:DNA mismatch repair protein MutS